VKFKPGQTLVLLLVFFSVAIIVTTGAVAVMIANTQASSGQELGLMAYQIAESGAEEALLRLIRVQIPPSSLPVGVGVATISVTGSGTQVITSTGVISGYSRTVQVTVQNTAGLLTILTWNEINP